MADCIDCGKDLGGHEGHSICVDCAGKRIDVMSLEEQVAMAKAGLDALIDEATGYQSIRPKGQLRQGYDKYLKDASHGRTK